MSFEGPCTVLGGLPLWAKCSAGVDDSPVCGREYWSEVNTLHWLKKDGTPGKEVSQAIYDKLEKYDSYWEGGVTEQVSDYLMHEQWLAEHPEGKDMIPFDEPSLPKTSS